MDSVLSGAYPVQIGFAIAIFGAVIGSLRRIDSRFNALERQVEQALRGRMTRQEHQIWVLQMQVKNPTLLFPDPTNTDPDA